MPSFAASAVCAATQHLPPEHKHALLVGKILAQLQPGADDLGLGQITPWQPPPGSSGYGEPWVQGLLQALATSAADLLVLPAPYSLAPMQRAHALTALEAARRHGAIACAWPSANKADAGTAMAWQYLTPAATGDIALPLQQTDSNPGTPNSVPNYPADDTANGMSAERSVGPPRDWNDLPRDAARLPQVSVIVRSMDRGTLVEALNSIALQTWPNVEVVIVNALGASHRSMPQHCGGFAVTAAAAPDGASLPRAQAANLGLDKAQGDLLLFLDDDDLLLPDHLAKLVAALEADPDAGAAFADVEMGHDEQGRWQPLHVFNTGFDPTRLLFENYLPIHSVLFKRSSELRLDERFDLFEDWDFWLQLTQSARFVHAPGVSARYRVHGQQQSQVFSDTPATREARNRLIEKWRLKLTSEQYLAAMQRLQQLHRSGAQAQAELALARDGAAAQMAVLRARELEIDNAKLNQVALQKQLQARELEIDNAKLNQIASLELVQAREKELADALAEIGSLQNVLKARDEEIVNLRSHVAQLEQELAALRTETPFHALKRTIRTKTDVSTRR